MNIQAAATFSNITSDISNSLETLRGLAEDHFAQDPDCVNWGHVGTLCAIQNDIESASMHATALAIPAHIIQQGLACHEPAPGLVARTEDEPMYFVTPQAPAVDASEDLVIYEALRILESRMRRPKQPRSCRACRGTVLAEHWPCRARPAAKPPSPLLS